MCSNRHKKVVRSRPEALGAEYLNDSDGVCIAQRSLQDGALLRYEGDDINRALLKNLIERHCFDMSSILKVGSIHFIRSPRLGDAPPWLDI